MGITGAKLGEKATEMASLASLLPGLGRRAGYERTGYVLYNAVVAAAREPYCYAALGVPDTFDGRFDLIGLHAILLIHRLRFLSDPGPTLAQAVFDSMFSDMDKALREMGVGDLSVGRKMRVMWEAFHGRARAYEDGLNSADAEALPTALARNVWRGTPPPGADKALARLTRRQRAHLEAQQPAALCAGQVNFLPQTEAAQ
jgi:cytochrome b pre-mRNA-processing protein 3